MSAAATSSGERDAAIGDGAGQRATQELMATIVKKQTAFLYNDLHNLLTQPFTGKDPVESWMRAHSPLITRLIEAIAETPPTDTKSMSVVSRAKEFVAHQASTSGQLVTAQQTLLDSIVRSFVSALRSSALRGLTFEQFEDLFLRGQGCKIVFQQLLDYNE